MAPFRTLLIFIFITISITLNAQKSQIRISLSGMDSQQSCILDSLRVRNFSLGSDTVLVYPDTILRVERVTGTQEIPGIGDFSLKLTGNSVGLNIALLSLPVGGTIDYALSDLSGRLLDRGEVILKPGTHEFSVPSSGNQILLFSVRRAGITHSLKILPAAGYNQARLKIGYVGSHEGGVILKSFPHYLGFSYRKGDILIFAGYSGSKKSGIWCSPASDTTIVFQFAGNIPCLAEPEITYEGQIYHAVQIGSQCWLKENMNVGTMIPVAQNQADNSIIEKYCYDDDPQNCITYGGLYQWWEMMQFNYTGTLKGICPVGWHVSTDLDWQILEGVVDSQAGPADPVWNQEGARGTDAGNQLKSSSSWNTPGGTDAFGFSALAAGYTYYGSSTNKGKFGHFWTSTPSGSPGNPWLRAFRHDYSNPIRNYFIDENGRSVRCVKN